MAEAPQAPEKSIRPPETKVQGVQYKDGRLARRITGEKGAKYDFNDPHSKYSPENGGKMGIVEDSSGNRFIIARNREGDTYVVNARATAEKGKLEALKRSQDNPDARLSALKF